MNFTTWARNPYTRNEAGEGIPEHVLVLHTKAAEAFNSRLDSGVDLFMGTVTEHESGGLLHLARVQDAVVVQFVAGVEQQVGIGGWSRRFCRGRQRRRLGCSRCR